MFKVTECFLCGGKGHIVYTDCTEPPLRKLSRMDCTRCGGSGINKVKIRNDVKTKRL